MVVGTVQNKSHEHIDAETFIKDIEKAILDHGSVRLVQAGAKREELRAEREDQNKGYVSLETAKKWGRELGADFMLDVYKRQGMRGDSFSYRCIFYDKERLPISGI